MGTAALHRRTDAPFTAVRLRVALVLAGLALAASAVNAQRLSARFGEAADRPADALRRAASRLAPGPAAPGPRLARADSRLTAGLFASEVVGGSVGAALGFYAGAAAGGRSCDVVGSCVGEDPGLGRAILGAYVGAWLGIAAGSHVGGGLAGGPTGSFASRLGAAAGGLLAATGLAALLQADFDRPATWIPVPVVAAAVTSLAVRRR